MPAANLEIADATAPTLRLSNGGGVTPSLTIDLIRNTGDAGQIVYAPGGGVAGGLYIRTTHTAGQIYFQTASSFGSNGSNERMRIDASGNVGINTFNITNAATLDVRGTSATIPAASASANSNFAAMVVDNRGSGDLFTASSSGLSRFVITQNGNVGIGNTLPLAKLDVNGSASVSGNLTLAGGARTIAASAHNTLTIGDANTGDIVLMGRSSGGGVGASNGIIFSGYGQGVLQPDANGRLTSTTVNLASSTYVTGVLPVANGGTGNDWSGTLKGALPYFSNNGIMSALGIGSPGDVLSVSSGVPSWVSNSSINFWNRVSGALTPLNITDDLLLGGSATSSAKIAFLNMAGGTATASLSATTTGLVLAADGSIQSIRNGTLTLGGSTTGNIALSPRNGTGGNLLLNLNSGGLYINGTAGATVTTDAQCVITSNGIVTSSGPCPANSANDSWQAANGILYQAITTRDVLIGGVATPSAKFAFMNVNPGSGTPTASISAGTSGAVYINAAGLLATTAKQSLTLGDGNTGNIVLGNGNFGTAGVLHNNAAGVISSSALNLAGGATEITGTLGYRQWWNGDDRYR